MTLIKLRIPDMQDIHDRHLDLNALVVLRTLVEERGVTRAAERLGLTQSAVSHALAKLRRVLGDPLLVRSPGGMEPTPRAQAIAVPLARALDDLVGAVRPPASFEPMQSDRRFRVATDDYLERVLLPPLLARLWQEGPAINISVASTGSQSGHDLAAGLVDVVIAPSGVIGRLPGAFTQRLFFEEFVCLVRDDHPLVRDRLSLRRFVALPHVLVAPGGRPGSIVDKALAREGFRRRVAVQVPHFLAALAIVRASDAVLTVGRRLAVAAGEGLRMHRPPLALPGFDVSLFWHERGHTDPGHVWLRRLVGLAARSI